MKPSKDLGTAPPAATLSSKYLSPRQAAARLGVCVATFYSRVVPNLPVVRIGRRTLIAEHRLAEYLASIEQGPQQ